MIEKNIETIKDNLGLQDGHFSDLSANTLRMEFESYFKPNSSKKSTLVKSYKS